MDQRNAIIRICLSNYQTEIVISLLDDCYGCQTKVKFNTILSTHGDLRVEERKWIKFSQCSIHLTLSRLCTCFAYKTQTEPRLVLNQTLLLQEVTSQYSAHSIVLWEQKRKEDGSSSVNVPSTWMSWHCLQNWNWSKSCTTHLPQDWRFGDGDWWGIGPFEPNGFILSILSTLVKTISSSPPTTFTSFKIQRKISKVWLERIDQCDSTPLDSFWQGLSNQYQHNYNIGITISYRIYDFFESLFMDGFHNCQWFA